MCSTEPGGGSGRTRRRVLQFSKGDNFLLLSDESDSVVDLFHGFGRFNRMRMFIDNSDKESGSSDDA